MILSDNEISRHLFKVDNQLVAFPKSTSFWGLTGFMVAIGIAAFRHYQHFQTSGNLPGLYLLLVCAVFIYAYYVVFRRRLTAITLTAPESASLSGVGEMATRMCGLGLTAVFLACFLN